MARQIYSIQEFYGIDQSKSENGLRQGTASDARNMDTTDGNLSVAKGFVKHISARIPGTGALRRLFIFKNLVTTQYVVIASNGTAMCVYAYTDTDETPEWKTIYTYPETVVGLRWDFLQVNIGEKDYLIIANGEHQMIKWDGESETAELFGSEENVSNIPANFICTHYSRLFAAGDPNHPSRLYWSQIPGDGATIENWGSDIKTNNSGGHTEIGDSRGDPIVGILAMGTQILVFKRYSVYRVQGYNPDNFRIEKIGADVERMAHSSIATYGDMAYYLTPEGLYYFNNVTVQPAPNSRRIQRFANGMYVELSKGAECKERLYFTCYKGDAPTTQLYDNAVIVYDIIRQSYMIRDGFEVADIVSHDGVLYMINSNHYIYRMNEGDTYDGEPIHAYWQTQKTDMGAKYSDKTIKEVYLRGEGETLNFRVFSGSSQGKFTQRVSDADIIEIYPDVDSGRTFAFRFENEAGGHFLLEGGMEVIMTIDNRSRTK